MFPSRSAVLLSSLAALLAGCSNPPPPVVSSSGSVRVAVSHPLLPTQELARVTVSLSTEGASPVTAELTRTEGGWGGVLEGVPVGAHHTLTAQGLDPDGTPRYAGTVGEVPIRSEARTLVALALQLQGTVRAPALNEAPVIDALVLTPEPLTPGAEVTLVAQAHDPNPGDALSFAWTDGAGGVGAPSQATTRWTVPAASGPVTLRLGVSDAHGGASSVDVDVQVAPGEGTGGVDVRFHGGPWVMPEASRAILDVGQRTDLAAVVSSAVDRSALGYQWSATCAGTFDNAHAATARFTPTALPAGTCDNCRVSVAVTDGRGGALTRSLPLCVLEARSASSTGTWAPTGSLGVGRRGGRAWSLDDGRVLLIGGYGSRDNLSSSELYAPDTGTWRSVDMPCYGRETDVRLDSGQLLSANGLGEAITQDCYETASLFDPASNSWSSTHSKPARRDHGLVRLADGRALAPGGYVGVTPVATTELYVPATDTWTPTGSLLGPRAGFSSVVLLDGKVLVLGGQTAEGCSGTVELYDPVTGRWSLTGSMNEPRYGGSPLRLPDGRVLVTGGQTCPYGPTQALRAELYDPSTGTWTPTGPAAAYTRRSVLPDGNVLFLSEDLSARLYEPATDVWRPTGDPLHKFPSSLTVLSNGQVLVLGARESAPGVYVMAAQVYDPDRETWRATEQPAQVRYGPTAILLRTGRVLAAGGTATDKSGHGVTGVELYTP